MDQFTFTELNLDDVDVIPNLAWQFDIHRMSGRTGPKGIDRFGWQLNNEGVFIVINQLPRALDLGPDRTEIIRTIARHARNDVPAGSSRGTYSSQGWRR